MPVSLAEPIAVVADFNGDGRPDVAFSASASQGGAGLVLGLADGGLGPEMPVDVGTFGQLLAVGDLNHDGLPDLVAAGQSGAQGAMLGVALGLGNGTFAPPQVTSLGDVPEALATGDFDGDGNLDVAVAGQSQVAVYFGRGGGALSVPWTAPGRAEGLAAGDFDHDGIDDLAVSFSTAGEVRFYAGSQSRALVEQTQSRVPLPAARALAVADFDQDGNLDLAAAVSDLYHHQVLLLRGLGNLSFVAGSHAEVAEGARHLTAADLDSDGVPDVVVTGDDAMSVLTSRGGAPLAWRLDYPLGGDPGPALVADLDGNGALDLVVPQGSPNALAVLLARAPGVLVAEADVPALANNPWALADLDGDGRPEVVTGAAWLSATGDARLMSIHPFAAPPVQELALGDVDGDGLLDLAVLGPAPNWQLQVLPGLADGGFGPPGAPAPFDGGGHPSQLQVANFTGDGRADLLAFAYGIDQLEVLPSTGAGFGQAVGTTITFAPGAVARADLNGDGISDLVLLESGVFNQSATYQALLGSADGSFHVAWATSLTVEAGAPVLVDLDGDGRLDLLANGYPDLQLFAGQGDGTFAAPVAIPGGTGFTHPVVVADVDGDGVPDLLVEHDVNGLGLRRGLGGGAFAAEVLHTEPEEIGHISRTTLLTAEDLDGDGHPEILGRSWSGVRVIPLGCF